MGCYPTALPDGETGSGCDSPEDMVSRRECGTGGNYEYKCEPSTSCVFGCIGAPGETPPPDPGAIGWCDGYKNDLIGPTNIIYKDFDHCPASTSPLVKCAAECGENYVSNGSGCECLGYVLMACDDDMFDWLVNQNLIPPGPYTKPRDNGLKMWDTGYNQVFEGGSGDYCVGNSKIAALAAVRIPVKRTDIITLYARSPDGTSANGLFSFYPGGSCPPGQAIISRNLRAVNNGTTLTIPCDGSVGVSSENGTQSGLDDNIAVFLKRDCSIVD